MMKGAYCSGIKLKSNAHCSAKTASIKKAPNSGSFTDKYCNALSWINFIFPLSCFVHKVCCGFLQLFSKADRTVFQELGWTGYLPLSECSLCLFCSSEYSKRRQIGQLKKCRQSVQDLWCYQS